MRKLLIILFLLQTILSAQVVLTYEGQIYRDTTCLNVNGITVPHSVKTTFTFKNNYVESCNTFGYMLQAGHENIIVTHDNNLEGEQIIGNKFVWKGDQNANTITHGVFTGYQNNARIMYNYLDYVPMGIIRKSNGMTDTSGVVAYNIIRNPPAVGVVVKGMNGVRIYNNTFYSEDSTYVGPGIGTWRGLIDVYKNDSPVADAKYVKIKNNIFYTVNRIYSINVMDTSCLQGFESDYNIFWCENGKEPVFLVAGVQKSLAQWREMGYDTHSHVMDPYFINTTDLVPSWRMQWGTPTEFDMGIAANADWEVGQDIALVKQSGYWQQGARIYEGGMTIFYDKGRVMSGDTINIPLKTGKIYLNKGEVVVQY